MLKLISWNIAGRLSKLNQQIDYLNSGEFDIICLQEVISKTHSLITENLREYNTISALELGRLPKIGKHKYNLLILSKAELHNNRPSHYIKWSEKYLSGILKYDNQELEVTTMHVPPGSSNGIEKIISIEQFYKNIIHSKNMFKIVCGDWNTPRKEFKNKEVQTWMKTGRESKRWDDGERLLLQKLKHFGIYDSYRVLNGYSKEEFSWYTNRKGLSKGRRYDHIHSSETLDVKKCYYDHTVRENKLSDHSAIISEFNFR